MIQTERVAVEAVLEKSQGTPPARQPRVSIIVPVYNAEKHIGGCLRSISLQEERDFPLQVIVIDDGSTDGTPALLDELRRQLPNLTVVRQPNSGWPGLPRNKGMSLATGDYVYFVDADDYLFEGSLRAMVAFADQHGSDIVLPKIKAVNRFVHEDVFEETQVDADIRKLVRSNFVCKLFRSDFLRRTGLKFDERKIRLEDAIFCFNAYAASTRTSILADRDYYVLNLHDDGSHISHSAIDPVSHSESVDRCLAALRSGTWPAETLAEAEADFFRRVVLVRYNSGFRDRSPARQLAWIHANTPLARDHIRTETALRHYSQLNRARLWGLRHGDVQAVLAASRQSGQRRPLAFARAATLSSGGGRIHITGSVTPAWGTASITALAVEARTASGAVVARCKAAIIPEETDELLTAERVGFTAGLSFRSLLGKGTVRLYTVATADDETTVSSRLSLGQAQLPAGKRVPLTIAWSATRFDGVSVRLGVTGAGRLRRVAQAGTAALARIRTSLQASPVRRRFTRRPEIRLPAGRYFSLTWTIPTNFGGMTSVLLHRSATFARLAGKPVDILTLSPDLDLPAQEEQLRTHGQLAEGVRLRNLWYELRDASDNCLARLPGATAPTDISAPGDDLEAVELRLRTEYRSADGTVVRTDHHRTDGSLLLVERQLRPRDRRMTLCNRSGAPVAEWPSPRRFYFAWLDFVIGRSPAFLINDSKAVGKFLYEYRRDHVIVTQVLHSTHIDKRAKTLRGPITGYHFDILRNISQFDLVTVLTEAQRSDVQELLGECGNLAAIPNAVSAPSAEASAKRKRTAGVVVGRLIRDKRVDHALQALADPNCSTDVTLTVIGSGPDADRLKDVRTDLGLTELVTFAGHVPHARGEFATASFSLLCSRYEGMGLVLVESMAMGCIPIAYDVRYGPADIITDGVDGFLVADGDIAGLAATIERVVNMPPDEMERMRAAARRRAADFSDAAVIRRWADELALARSRKSSSSASAAKMPKPRVSRVQLYRTGGLIITGTIPHSDSAGSAKPMLQVMARKAPILFRLPIQLEATEENVTEFSAEVPVEGLLDTFPAAVLDFYLQPAQTRSGTGTRVPAPEGFAGAHCGILHAYSTEKGNLSIKISEE